MENQDMMLTREADRCFNCETTEGRIEHGGYYRGRPVCDACNEYAEANGGAERPVTYPTAMNLIATAVDLDSLYSALVDIEANAPDDVRGDIDYSRLPTFGGRRCVDLDGIWSWDETRVIRNDDGAWHLEDRNGR